MMTTEYVIKVKQLLDESPIDPNQEFSFLNNNNRKTMLENRRGIEILKESMSLPINVVLMGEVKSGKSTLLNAIAGETISPTGTTETTAAIISVKNAAQKSAKLIFKDGRSEAKEFDDLYKILDDNRNDVVFFNQIESVKLEMPLERLKKLSLVDTPGLQTITDENQQLTINYIQNADVVLWVLSAHHLGQYDIEEQIEKVNAFGKPIIIVINRVDEVDADPEDLVEYVEDHLGLYAKAVFPVSAQLAFDSIVSANDDNYELSGMNKVLKYIQHNIERNNATVKDEIIQSSLIEVINKEKYAYAEMNTTIDYVLNAMEKRQADIRHFSDRIKNNVSEDIKNWLEHELLRKEQRTLESEVESLGVMASKNSYGQITLKLNEYNSEKYLNAVVSGKSEDIWNKINSEKERALEIMGENLKNEEHEFYQQLVTSTISLGNTTSLKVIDNDIMDGAIKGAVVGGAYGIAAATYTAVIGPYAAIYTIGGSLASFMPPVLLVGAATGAAIKLISNDKKKKELHGVIANNMETTRTEISSHMYNWSKKINQDVEDFFQELYVKISNYMTNGLNEDTMLSHKIRIEKYYAELDSLFVQIKN